ncbi:MAG: glycoside hydrolase family 3 C-terminal domain-containing protein [Spirochaetaceae bacterium]|nr:glycoside hydrolase family 3 C-terminal domain-containing protein [Spirochaetaceae bacterium]
MNLYKNANAPIADRIDDLMSRMTLEEKIGQMIQLPAKEGIVEENYIDRIYDWHIGSFLHCTGKAAEEIQRMAEKSRLGIPVIFGIDAIHGHCFEDKGTVFPSQLSLSCSWDRQIVKEMARVTAKEVRACGIHWTFSPVLCIGRDARWGRVDETFGEDPWLIGELACAAIEGYQGDSLDSEDSILACAKHFAGYGEATGGRDSFEADVSKRKMLSIFLPPFEKAVKKAKVASLMTGYQSNNGLPATSDSWLLREITKKQWGFKGFIVTDWDNVGSLYKKQKVARDLKDAARQGIVGGNDMMMSTDSFFENALQLVQEGTVSEDLIEDSVRRVLKIKFEMGLFDDKRHIPTDRQSEVLGRPEHWDVALDASRESMTLLTNNGVLPLQDMKNKKILLTGSNGDDVIAQLGDWSFGSMQAGHANETYHREDTVTLRDGLKKTSEKYGFDFEYIKGADVLDNGFDETDLVKKRAKNSDYIIVCVGDTIAQHGEGHDRSDLSLTGKQQKLLEVAKASGKKLIVVYIASKPLAISWVKENADAIICCFNPGAKGGTAITEVLLGELNPSGKLTISFPYSAGQIPVFYNKYTGWHSDNEDGKERYIDLPEEPVFSFGEGISYSRFSYSDLKVLTSSIKKGENPQFEVTITNISDVDGTEIAQLYINDVVSTMTTPCMNLKGFHRVDLKAGMSKTVQFTVDWDELAIIDADLKKIVERGEFEVWVGPSSIREKCLKSSFWY